MICNWKCGICGKFAVIVDSYTDFGGCQDLEPPDEVLMCQKCVDESIKACRLLGTMLFHWLPAYYEDALAKELGFERFTPEGSGWSYWKKIKGDV